MRLQICDRDYYTVAAIGKSREITPEGFLLCRGVAIARTGIQTYKTGELPLDPNSDGLIIAERRPEDVFLRESMASFEGKPATVNHPDGEFVKPENWKRYSIGIVQNVRQGDGAESDLLLADVLVTSADAIAYVNREFPQISAGYNCDYEKIGPGRYVQRNIIGNHVAFLRHGRAGPRCSIKDEDTTVKKSKLAKLLAAFGVANADTVAEAVEEIQVSGTPTTDSADDTAVKALGDRVGKIESGIEDLKKLFTKDADEAKQKAEEEAAAAAVQPTYAPEAVREIVARAEILAPGISIPTTDALAAGDAAEQLMRTALEKASSSEAGAECVKPFLMGRELKVLTADALTGVFNGAAELTRVRNNDRTARSHPTKDFGKPTSIADINEANRKFWAEK